MDLIFVPYTEIGTLCFNASKDYVDCEEKEYRRMIDEFNEY